MKIVGKGMLRLHAAIPLQQMVMGVIIFVAALVWFTTGFIGIGVLIIGTIIGLLPPRIGIRRSHGMGIIIVPIMIYTFHQASDVKIEKGRVIVESIAIANPHSVRFAYSHVAQPNLVNSEGLPASVFKISK